MEGQEFGHYRLETRIGSGGMGDVYRAHDLKRDRVVALKLLPELFSGSDEFQQRFRRESRVAARLRDPHIIPIHDYGEIDRRLYIDMRLVDGGATLAHLLRDVGRLPPERAVDLVGQVAEALDAAHADGLIHRDVKPSNVLVAARDFVYVVDFGIAHAIGHTSSGLTLSGATIGTLDYMAPERFGHGPVDRRVDVYSLACVLYQCLTARTPFGAAEVPAVLWGHLHDDPPAPSVAAPRVPVALDRVVATGMAKDPEDRYPTAGALAEDARLALGVASARSGQTGASALGGGSALGGAAVPRRPTAPLLGGAPATGAAGPTSGPWRPPPGPPGPPSPRSPGPARMPAPPPGPPAPAPEDDERARRRSTAILVAAVGAVLVGLLVLVLVLVPAGTEDAAPPSTVAGPAVVAPPRSVPDPAITGAIATSPTPATLAVAPGGRLGYLVNRDPRQISVVDLVAGRVVGAIPITAAPPRFVALSADGSRLYVTCYDEQDTVSVVSVVDTWANAVIATVPVGARPYALAIAPDQRTVWVPSHDTASIDVVDTATNTVVRRVPVASNPHWVAFRRDRAYVANHESDLVSVLDPATFAILATVPVGVSPHSVAVSPDGTRVSVANYDGDSVSVIDTATNQVVATVPVGRKPQAVAYTPDGRHLYTADVDGGTVSVVDTTSNLVTATVGVGSSPTAVIMNPRDGRALVPLLDESRVAVLGATG